MLSHAFASSAATVARHAGSVCRHPARDFSAARAAVAAALLLGRSRLLCSGGARHSAHGEFYSAFHGFERASAAGDGLDCAVVESGGLRSAGNADGHAGLGCFLASGRVSAGGARGEYAGCDCGHVVHRGVSGILRAKFFWHKWIWLRQGLSSGGWRLICKEARSPTVLWFSLAALAKETAILAPLALAGWEMVGLFARRRLCEGCGSVKAEALEG